ncbi:MAG: glycoside hydrolase family 43 protein [Actinomycetota bacterium]|nr:glycoside hydrolase family 43 protein [Actinomycetota bacterium]
MARVRLLVLLLLAPLAAALLVPVAPAGAYAGAPWFRPSQPYTQNFPDPSVVVNGGRYYAYGTATGGAYLPAMSSSDAQTWVARPAYDPGPPLNSDRNFNDALPYPASWSPDRNVEGRLKKEVWAPGVAAIGGRFVAFYAARVAPDRDRFCLSVATATNPLGPFEDRTTAPLWCDDDPNGSIDPQPFVDGDGTPYLLWKSEGVPGSQPTRIWSRMLDAAGTGVAPGSAAVEVLRTSQAWEGDVIENPSMVRWQGQLFLFYSGNEHRSADYATGYAECATPTGPCTKSATNPIIASRAGRLGPGGPAAFVGTAGQLLVAYHWWNAPYTNYPAYPACQQAGTCTSQGQRRMAVEPVRRTPSGLQVGDHPTHGGLGGDRAVAMATTPTGDGYWIAGATGAVAARGGAGDSGSISGLTRPVVGMAATPTGAGYWMTGGDGGVFSFGDAAFHGSTGDLRLNQPVVAMASTPTGRGYWFVASDGGIFSFGDAAFFGSTGSIRLNQPIVGMASTPTGRGYWLVASDGGIFSFGDASFFGSTGDLRLNRAIVGMVATRSGRGYQLVASDGGIFTFGDGRFLGSTGDIRLNQPIVGMAGTPSGNGYWMVAADGGIFSFGDAAFHGAGN